jgi:GNAT superfamily N-acetyltransferase
MSPETTLRPAGEGDLDLLLRIYASTRTEELAQVPWTDLQKEAFLRFQFDAQHKHYHEHFPDAQYAIIVVQGRPAGRLYVHRRQDEIRLVDIALLPEHRGAGVGSALLAALIAEARAAHKPLRIHVEQFNPALRLYQRLGFVPVAETGVYLLLECR